MVIYSFIGLDYGDGYKMVIDDHSYVGYIDVTGIEVVECKYDYFTALKLLEIYNLNQKRIEKLKTII